MKIVRSKFESRQYMLRPKFELSHLRDVIPNDVKEHNHDFYEVYFINSGVNFSYMVENQLYALQPGDVLIIDRFDSHRPVIDGSSIYDRILLWISAEYISDLGTAETDLSLCFREALASKKNLLRMDAATLGHFRGVMGKLEKTYFSSNLGDDVLIKSYLAETLVILNRAFKNIREEEVEDDVRSNIVIDKVLQYISDNLSEKITLDGLSDQFYINKYHLLRQFKKNVGYTVYQYIMLKRFLLAEKYLSENMPATEVYHRCGFKNYSTFIQAFTKHYGIPPGQYAKQTIRYNEQAYLP